MTIIGFASNWGGTPANCPHDCLCDAPKQRLQTQHQPSRLIEENKETEGFFEVLSLSYHSPITIPSISFGHAYQRTPLDMQKRLKGVTMRKLATKICRSYARGSGYRI